MLLVAAGGCTVALMVRANDSGQQVKLIVALAIPCLAVAALLRPHLMLHSVVSLGLFNFAVSAAGVGPLNTSDFLVLAAAVSLLPFIRPHRVSPWLRWGTALLVLGSLGAAIWSQTGSAWWDACRWVAFAIIALMLVQQRHVLLRVPVLWSGALLIMVLGALAQRSGTMVTVVGEAYLSDRLDSFFGYYTQFAGFTAVATVVALAAMWGSRSPLLVVLHAAAAAVGLFGVVIAQSRGAVAALGVGVAVLVVLHVGGARDLIKCALGTVALVAALNAWIPPENTAALVDRFGSVASAGSDAERIKLQNEGLELLRDNPIGIGAGNFQDASPVATLYHSHSTLIQIGLDAGWIGLLGFLLVFVAPIAVACAHRLRRGPLGHAAAGFVAGLAGAMAQGWNDYLFYESAWGIVMAALAAGGWASLATERLRAARPAAPHPDVQAAA